mmetsp:Transcript_23400/g.48617  ORF Transcript_23400/g.48617 Transcript_23400/m.48617 type:complete len:253 (+) Transcript_23400:2-760(+)
MAQFTDAWVRSLGYEYDVPKSTDFDPAIGLASLDLASPTFQESLSDSWTALPSEAGQAVVKSGFVPSQSLFTADWMVDVKASMADFMRFAMPSPDEMTANAAQWDSTFVEAEILAEKGDGDPSNQDPESFARIMRWVFSMPSPFKNREMLYLVAASRMGGTAGGVIVNYISVKKKGQRDKKLVLARNLVPSFDLAVPQPDGTIRILHRLTTDIGVSQWVWNKVFRSPAVENYKKEAAHVVSFLEEGADGAKA